MLKQLHDELTFLLLSFSSLMKHDIALGGGGTLPSETQWTIWHLKEDPNFNELSLD